MSDKYTPKKTDKFAFGIWCIQNRGRDPFGEVTRPERSVRECLEGLAKRNVYAFEFHDNDIIPFGASAAERDRCIRELRKLMDDLGIKATVITTNLFYHPIFKDGAFTSTDPAIRAFATQKVMQCLDVGHEVGAEVYVFWGGREGTEVDASKDPITANGYFRDAVNFLCEYVLDNGYNIKFSIEPKPNEPRGDLYLPTVGSVLAF
ncbi:MAG: TIM barrel protein, partial [Casimicrobiaceae bacterium]|nr:TIM barrel protein [Casimicrobiaceae bacterium]